MGVSRAWYSWGSPYVLAPFPVSRGGIHLFSGAGTLAFAIRSGVDLILLLARIQRIREVPRFVQGYP